MGDQKGATPAGLQAGTQLFGNPGGAIPQSGKNATPTGQGLPQTPGVLDPAMAMLAGDPALRALGLDPKMTTTPFAQGPMGALAGLIAPMQARQVPEPSSALQYLLGQPNWSPPSTEDKKKTSGGSGTPTNSSVKNQPTPLTPQDFLNKR